ncbi:MAG: hypothetical protein IPO15_22040 [Anaerolineae bacterium]|uniref:hypothetical protein n=1 Tax=Candidatus Amarolinea dominans TaxID=3140696 RepID=UPI0031366F71|nr:hypothetical protein [Anaerolineae bacterium]
MIVGNLIGTDASGLLPLGNAADGIVASSGASFNQIGNTNQAARNVISTNGAAGIAVWGADTTDNVVRGNLIGLGADGLTALGNETSGMYLLNSTKRNVVGGSLPGARNVISANGENGLGVWGAASDTTVSGNFIGTDATGTVARGNPLPGHCRWHRRPP